MKYMGSKNRIAKHILPIMLKEMEEKGYTTWVEPFCGGGNVIDKVPDKYKRIGADLKQHTIAAMLGIRDFVDELPSTVSEEQYKNVKGTEPHPVNSWVRFGGSFGGKFDNGYARSKDYKGNDRNHIREAKTNALKQSPKIQTVEFLCCSYEALSNITNSLIYCDSPYQGTTGYKTGAFDHEKFFAWCREMKSKGNSVFVSEYNAPEDFELVWQGEVKTNFSSTRKSATHNAIEKLFKV
jgi:DNA adenine methylase